MEAWLDAPHFIIDEADARLEDLPRALEFLVTYPFPPAAVNTLRGDYFNADLNVDIDLSTIVDNFIAEQPPPGTAPPAEGDDPPAPDDAGPDLPLPLDGEPADPLPRPEPPEPGSGGLPDLFGGFR